MLDVRPFKGGALCAEAGADLGPEVVVVAIWAILSFAAALKIFRWE